MSNEIIKLKTIKIVGQCNRYQMKKVTKIDEGNPIKKTSIYKTFKYDKKYFTHNEQKEVINDLSNSNLYQIVKQQINKKISGYKQQDMKKKNYDENSKNYNNIIDFNDVITKMKKVDLKCYYCLKEMLILYENVRDENQWTVDRINNDIGHIKSNFNLVCLKCNLKRRRQSNEKYLFTSQLSINKLQNK